MDDFRQTMRPSETGLADIGHESVGLISGGVQVGRWNGQGIGIDVGSPGAPSVYFQDHPATGIFHPDANAFGVTVNGMEILRMSGSARAERLELRRRKGNVAIHATGEPDVDLHLKAEGRVRLGAAGHRWPDDTGEPGQILQLQDATTGEMAWAETTGAAEPPRGFRNAIINGAFDIWQRGLAHNMTGGTFFSADRFQHGLNDGECFEVVRMKFPVGQTQVAGNPEHYMRLRKKIATGVGPALRHKIENVGTFAGATVTLSYWARAASALAVDAITFRQVFGRGGSDIRERKVPQPPTYTDGWVRYCHTLVIPDLSAGSVVGDNHCLEICWTFPDGNWVLDIADVQLELGPSATPFERRPLGFEQALCQRYFTKSQAADVAPGATGAAVFAPVHKGIPHGGILADVRLTAPMRVVPALKIFSADGKPDQVSTDSTGDTAAVSVQNGSQTGFQIINNTGACIEPAAGIYFHYAADSEL